MKRFLLAISMILWAASSAAKPWTVDTAKSTLTFSGTQSGEAFQGAFTKFTPKIEFDEAHLDQSHIRVTVQTASVTAQGKDQAEALPTKDWLDVAAFPTAEFVSRSITKTAEHQFAATGTLTLHGIARELTLPFTLVPENGATRATGSVTLGRQEYKIGQGRWASDQWIAYPAEVRYSILARPQ